METELERQKDRRKLAELQSQLRDTRQELESHQARSLYTDSQLNELREKQQRMLSALSEQVCFYCHALHMLSALCEHLFWQLLQCPLHCERHMLCCSDEMPGEASCWQPLEYS
jgi:hypothetical protein